jgi:hypothetical protein
MAKKPAKKPAKKKPAAKKAAPKKPAGPVKRAPEPVIEPGDEEFEQEEFEQQDEPEPEADLEEEFVEPEADPEEDFQEDDDMQHAGEDDVDPEPEEEFEEPEADPEDDAIPLNSAGTKTGRVSAAKANKANGPKSSKAVAAPFSGSYEYELDGEIVRFTKRRALAFKAFLDTDGEADPAIVAADMEKEFGPAKKGTHLASARRIRGTYLKLREAGVFNER